MGKRLVYLYYHLLPGFSNHPCISNHSRSGRGLQGYGYQFWRCRYNNYRGDGAFGQFCIVMPEQDAVLAITSGTTNIHGILDLVWEYLLPAMKDDALPSDK